MVWLTQELEWGQDSMSENVKQNNFTQEDFQFVQINEKIFDKKFETKAVGYFKDALRRFAKNKTSLVAFFVLVFIPQSSREMKIQTISNNAKIPPQLAKKYFFKTGRLHLIQLNILLFTLPLN